MKLGCRIPKSLKSMVLHLRDPTLPHLPPLPLVPNIRLSHNHHSLLPRLRITRPSIATWMTQILRKRKTLKKTALVTVILFSARMTRYFSISSRPPPAQPYDACQVARVKNKWKCILKDGMIHVNGKDYLFAKCTGCVYCLMFPLASDRPVKQGV